MFNQKNESKFEHISKNYQLKQAQLETEHHKVLSEERKRHIQRLQSVISELQSFSHSVAHDLRAPLRSIKGFSQILTEDYRDHLDATAQNYLDKIILASVRMASLIDDIMRLSQITSREVHITPVDLSTTAEAILARLYDSQPTRQVEWRVTPGLMVTGDNGLLEVALDNLLNNAWKYSSKREQALIEFGCEERGEERVFFVRDNGAGFDMDYQDKLFHTFSRLHRVEEFEGTGVGLATVKRIVERHGGQIWAEGTVDQGATFYFTLHNPLEQ
ncbi:MAG: hypothetical protein JNJ61_16470 [Anaerolineae bacterium]|nr:hypothetical protein [Anaerolineae bacterium]